MVKLGKTFSILVVFALLILLAPAVILLPGQSVAANGEEEVVQEVEATFCFTETDLGNWHNFTAGSSGIDTEGLYLGQFARADVTRAVGNPLSNCQFRNYTTASGTVAGTGLNGDIDLSWITWKFGDTYPYTPKYNETADNGSRFGTMMGRGHIDEGGGDNMTFVFILDYDSNDDMSAAAGKGFMVSVEENGRFGNDPDPANRHKIIGDFEINKTAGNYTGVFHLRNYAPNEVYDLGWLNVTGGVVQEAADDIYNQTGSPNLQYGLDILDFSSDGPRTTPLNTTTCFEEVAWGKDLAKTITSGHLGIGGDMLVARNTALYLELRGWVLPSGEVRIMGTTVNKIYINDTYAVTGEDGSPYGELYELLLLFIPNQILPVGQNFTQHGFTFTPFGMPDESTECYAGSENFALAEILIASSLFDAAQWSIDHSYGLYPHPKVTSVDPDNGDPGQTLNVTINGKYFIAANGEKSGWIANSGSVNFEQYGIAVNNYTVINSTAIEANITINSVVCPGPVDVTVTSCFGYKDGKATEPYKSGVKDNCFTITGATGTLEGQVSFWARDCPSSEYIQPFVVKVFENGTNLANEVWTGDATTNTSGVFTIDLTPGSYDAYDIAIKNCTCLSEVVTNRTLTAGDTTVADFGYTREGDVDGDDRVFLVDVSLFCTAWNTKPGDDFWNPNADLNRDGRIFLTDVSLFCSNWNLEGDARGHF